MSGPPPQGDLSQRNERGVRGMCVVSPLAFCLALCLSAGHAAAVDPNRSLDQLAHDTWSAKDGLPDGSVFAILQSRDGYLWLGTQLGLARFDGVRFAPIEDGSRMLEQHTFARSLLQGKDGAVWAALAGGVARYADGRISLLDERQGLLHPFVYALAPGPAGSIWVGTGGSGVWRLSAGRFSHHPAYLEPGLPAQVNDLAVDVQGTLWVATDDGLLALGKTPRRYGPVDGLGSLVVNALAFDRSGTLWVGTRGGLSRHTGLRFRTYTVRDGLPHNDVTALLEDREGSLWVGTRDAGLVRFIRGRFERPQSRCGPSHYGVLAIAEDRSGSIWIGTNRGLERYRDAPFITFGRDEGFAYENLLNVTPRRAGGLWVLDGAGSVLIHESGQTRRVAPPGTIAGNGMLGMLETEDGSLWVGGEVLHRLRSGRWERFSNPAGNVDVIISDGKGLLIAQTQGDGKSTLWRFADGRFAAVHPNVALVHIQRLYRDHSQRLWVSTAGHGLIRFDSNGQRVLGMGDGLPHDVVYGLVEDDSGSLWAGTRGGLARIRNDTIFSFAGIKGMPCRSPLHLQLDGLGSLWVTADDGIYRAQIRDLDAVAEGRADDARVEKLGVRDGLRTIEVSWRSSGQARTRDGQLWYATASGLALVRPAAVRTSPPAPEVYIEELLLGGRPTVVPAAAPIDAGRERIEIRFTAPSLTAPDGVRFRYRLSGYDDSWIEEQARRVAYYTNLPAGTYAFHVSARQGSGPWGPNEASLLLRIKPRWHETITVRLFALGMAGLALLGVHHLRTRHLRQREQRLVGKVAKRTEALRQEVEERCRAEEQVRRLNAQLESRVRERTAQLEAANEALAADIAQRQRAETALAEEKERLAVTLRSLAEGVITTDMEGRIVLMNPVAEAHTGWTATEAAGQKLSQVFRVVDRLSRQPLADPVASVLSAAAATTETIGQGLLQSRNRQALLLDASAAPIRDSDGRVLGGVLVFWDVTEKTRAEEQMQRVAKLEAVGLLAAGVAHDFNNLLGVIRGYAESLLKQLTTGKPRHKLEQILHATLRAADLTRQLLAFSRRQVIQPTIFDLNVVIEDVRKMIARLIGEDVHLRVIRGPDLGRVKADPGQIGQIVMNLAVNARDAMPAGGELRIETANADLDEDQARRHPPLVAGRYVTLSVCDSGTGMDAATQARIFDPFFTTKPIGRGTGLGLATVYGIVKQSDGFISVNSELGLGTTFKIYLPRVDDAPDVRVPA